MKIGALSESVIKRSILKQFEEANNDSIYPMSIEEMCAGIKVDANIQTIFVNALITGDEKDLGIFGIAKVVNDLATRGGTPLGVGISLLLPPYAYESRLKEMMFHVEKMSGKCNVPVLFAKAEVSQGVSTSVFSITGIGGIQKDVPFKNNREMKNQDIVLLKDAGLEGSLRILRKKEKEIKKRFTATFLRQIAGLEEELLSVTEILYAYENRKKYGVTAIQQISSGGLLATLWELLESVHLGMDISLKAITFKQVVIELCEFCQVNPYQITSVGSAIILAIDGEGLVNAYRRQGVKAVVLGKTTSGRERIIQNGYEKRFLERPQMDELLKI